jgi:hypothetical protein
MICACIATAFPDCPDAMVVMEKVLLLSLVVVLMEVA